MCNMIKADEIDFSIKYHPRREVYVIKKDGTLSPFNINKVIKAIGKSAYRALTKFTVYEQEYICQNIINRVDDMDTDKVHISDMHNMVEQALDDVKPAVAKSYRDYRNYKQDFVVMMDDIYKKAQSIMFIGDKENANSDSALVSTKRALIFNQINKELYQKFFMTTEELQACRDGYIYIHDMSSRRDTLNCCLCDISTILMGGFEMGNVWYNEPNSLDTAFDVIGDVTLSAASQQYGGFTLPEIDKVLEPYAQKSYDKYVEELKSYGLPDDKVEEIALKKLEREFDQGFQGWEYKFNTVGSSRGDYPFITASFGLSTTRFGKMCNKSILRVRSGGQGKPGFKKPVLFPKLIFLYDENLHGEDKECEDVFLAGIECSSKTMYPDYISLSGKGYISETYQSTGRAISAMGCIFANSMVEYIFDGKEYKTTIEELYNKAKNYTGRTLKANSEGQEVYLDNDILKIWDCKLQDYTVVSRVIARNAECNSWLTVTIESESGTKTVHVTTDHPFEVEEVGVVLAKDLKASEHKIMVQKEDKTTEIGTVVSVDVEDYVGVAYDVTTASEHFTFDDIYSHNCRAFLSPWYERGGLKPADEDDKPIFVGRGNIGVVSLHLPMILAKSRQENKDFYEVLDYYLEMIRQLHLRTYEYLGEMRASTNPLMYCMGGFYGGHLDFHDKIKPVLKSFTASFGITALNELNRLYNGKSIAEDGQFPLEVMQHINDKIAEYKHQDGRLYAIYGTPAESLCFAKGTMVQTYRGDVPIEQIVPGDLVYSLNDDGKIELKKVLGSAKTNEHAVVVKVKLDNGQEVICTPNHPFAVRKVIQGPDGKITKKEVIEWIQAADLKPGARLKSNYITINSHGRPQCSIYYNGARQLLHIINAEYVYGPIPDGSVVHHRNEDKTDNSFENLEVMTDADHKRHHLKDTIESYQYTSCDQLGEKNNFYGKHHTEESKLANRLAHMGKKVVAVPAQKIKDRVIAFSDEFNRIIFDCIGDVKDAGFTEHLVRLACRGDYNNHFYKGYLWYYENDIVAAEFNHKVVSVEVLPELQEVFNIEVEDNHNYFVGGKDGMLVHNCGLQIKQFRAKYGIIENVSDREYVSNSFHCHVTEDITPIQKQDIEEKFWELFNGGKIQYVRYPIPYNKEAIISLVRRAMKKGYYEGVNMSLAYCDDCGHQELEMDVCPVCGSKNLTKIDRMNGYLAYSRVHGDTRLNAAKMEELKERKSM